MAIGLLLYALAIFAVAFLSFHPQGYRAHIEFDVFLSISICVFAGAIYCGTLFFLWIRHKLVIVRAVAGTLAIWIPAIILSFCVDINAIAYAIWSLAAAATLILGVFISRQESIGRSLRSSDGTLNLRCPKCHYKMVGLTQARCPECGQEYTLDQLLAQQDFQVLRQDKAVSS